MSYVDFLNDKAQLNGDHGFEALWLPEWLFDFQAALVEWSLRKGRSAIFADCGLGKTPMQLVWAENVARKTNGNVLILTPLAVSFQAMREAEKFGIEACVSRDGMVRRITITNYEKLHLFNPADFAGVVCDESSILKSFDGVRRSEITSFMRKIPYRLLDTATAAPNDYIELGTSSEALGYLGHMDMLNRFFKNDQNNSATGRMHGEVAKWRFKGHAEKAFWRWVCSWARAVRKPSDLGFNDKDFILPPLNEHEHIVEARTLAPGMLMALPAIGLQEQREERKRTVNERCEQMAAMAQSKSGSVLAWCHLNNEGDLLEKLIPNSVQVSGKDSDESKEAKFLDFVNGNIQTLITKPKIGAWGLNFQHCADILMFPSHSFEQYYQSVRRCWRFGQKKPVNVDIIATEGELEVMKNLKRKARQAETMFSHLVDEMNNAIRIDRQNDYTQTIEVPKWLCASNQ